MQPARNARNGIAHQASARYRAGGEARALIASRKPERIILRNDPDYDSDKSSLMEFRLTYAGKLYGSSTGSPRAKHKHEIRKIFHKQLKLLWEKTPHLNGTGINSEVMLWYDEAFEKRHPPHTIKNISREFDMFGYNFVPLVTERISLLCGLEILFLRPDIPGGILRSADIDNRLKTLFDVLRMPKSRSELGDEYQTPAEEEKPFFCLLQDDSLIAKISVEADMLLEQLETEPDENDARLIITVRLRPYQFHFGNMKFS